MTLEKPAGTASKLGNYELLKEQPGSSVGATWIARSAGDPGEGSTLFSLIRVNHHLTKKPNAAETLFADSQAALGFHHPNALGLTAVGDEGGELCVISAYHDGETLTALVTAAGVQGLPQPVVLRIVLDVLAALSVAHQQDPPLVHGELGPQHVLVGDDGVARLSGLVTARALSRLSLPLGAKNHERLSYAAPERVKAMSSSTAAAPPLLPRADVFSVGVILWEGLAKQRLFTSKIEAAIVQKVLTAPISALGTLPGISVPDPLAEAVQRALERDPAKRAQSVNELVRAIEALGPDAVATPGQVAAEVDKLAGKAVAMRKTEVRAEIARRAGKGSSSIPPPAPPKPSAIAPRKATLLGIVSPVAKPTVPAVEATPVPKPAPPVAASASPSAATVKATRPPAESLDLGEIEVRSPIAALPPPPPLPAAPAARLTPVDEPDRKAAAFTARSFGDALRPLPAAPKVVIGAPQPASAQALLEVAARTKTAATPASDVPSPRSKSGLASEKVGPGSTLGRYEILTPVARGGMASVWAAKLPGSRGFQKIFAIKTMLPDVSDDPDFESMFLDEGRVAARIRHPNVVEIIDLGEQDDVLYLVMEWVEGENLGALVKAARPHGGVPMPIILRIASQVCAGLHAAHELRDDDGNLLDLVHRDISPANVLVSTSGFVKIVDFGIAKSKGRLHVTRIGGTVKGKTPYLSPEQLGQQTLDRRSDIFSFGVLLYVLTTGLHPFRGDSDTKTIENIALREAVPLRAILATTPPEFEAIVLKALAKDPHDRFGTAGEMQRALDHVAASLGFTTTEEDVAAFVRKALGETLSKRAHELRTAIDRADGKAPAAAEGEAGPASKPTFRLPVEKTARSAVPAPPAGAEAAASLGADLPRSKYPNAVTLPDIPPIVEGSPFAVPSPAPESMAREEATSPPVTRSTVGAPPPNPRSSAEDGSIEPPSLPRKRAPVALIAVGAVVVVGLLVGGVALLTGQKKGPPATSPAIAGMTSTPVASSPIVLAPPPPTPTPPAPVPPAPAAAPEPPATQAADEPAPAPTQIAAPAPTQAVLRGKGSKTTPGLKPSGGKPKPKQPYNPPTL
jgi:serine/threonine protein kinase